MPRFPLILGAAVTAFCLACGALGAPAAQYPTTETSPTVYALNGSAPATPAGLDFLTGGAVTVDASFLFDVALDIDSSGNIVVYPARRVANGLATGTSIGLQKVSASYENYTQATKNGYVFDSVLVVPVGTVVAVDVLSTVTCTVYSLGASYFAKFIVDSINASQRAMYTRVLTDPNCGYIELTSGLPKK